VVGRGWRQGHHNARRAAEESPAARDQCPDQGDALVQGRLDVVLGLASRTSPAVRAELVRREPLLVAIGADHPLARRDTVGVAQLGDYELLLPSEESGSDWNQFISIVCAQAGVSVRRAPSTVHGSTVSAGLLHESAVVLPTLRWANPPAGIAFRPLVEPELTFPWSLMTSTISGASVQALVHSALELAHEQHWLTRDELSVPTGLLVDRASAA
jgi:DNA-binding transcriptional LysR family regulator